MGKVKQIRAAWRGWRAKRRFEKGKTTMFKSRTTQNVAAGAGASGGIAYGLLAGLRSLSPGLIPWDEAHDASLAIAVTALLTPVISRVLAFKRNPEKAP